MGLKDLGLVLALASLISLPLFSGHAIADTCGSCHSPSDTSPNGGWTYAPPVLCLVHDPIVGVNQTFELRLYVLSDSVYGVSDVKGELGGLTGGLKMKGGTRGSARTDGNGWSYLSWTLEAGAQGVCSITVNAGYSILYTHTSGGSKNGADYTDVLSSDITIGESALRITPGAVILTQGAPGSEIEMTAKGNVTGLRAAPSQEIDGIVTTSLTRTELSAGETGVLSISASAAKLTSSAFSRLSCSARKTRQPGGGGS